MKRLLKVLGAMAIGGLIFAACGSPAALHKPSKGLHLSASVIDPVIGSTVTYTATIGVVAPAVGTPTGTVAFQDGGANISTCASQALTSSVATCSVTYTAVGTHTITAVYGGDTNFTGSTSSALTIVVGQGQTTVTITEASGSAPATALAATGYASTPFAGPASSR